MLTNVSIAFTLEVDSRTVRKRLEIASKTARSLAPLSRHSKINTSIFFFTNALQTCIPYNSFFTMRALVVMLVNWFVTIWTNILFMPTCRTFIVQHRTISLDSYCSLDAFYGIKNNNGCMLIGIPDFFPRCCYLFVATLTVYKCSSIYNKPFYVVCDTEYYNN